MEGQSGGPKVLALDPDVDHPRSRTLSLFLSLPYCCHLQSPTLFATMDTVSSRSQSHSAGSVSRLQDVTEEDRSASSRLAEIRPG